MREIKFRAWDKVDKVMMDNVYMRRVDMSLIDFKRSIEGPRWTVNMECDDIVLMQFTGLKARNGKEIYEGDIVSWSKESAEEVIFRNGQFTVESVGEYHRPYWKACKVIGNIHENLELLEQSK